jgi:hypothetical protein
MLVKDVIRLGFDLPPVINISMLNQPTLIRDLIFQYKVTDYTAREVLDPLLEYMLSEKGLPIFLQGPFGAGKSHTLCLLAGIITLHGAIADWEKGLPIANFPFLEEKIRRIKEKQFHPSVINCLEHMDQPLDEMLLNFLGSFATSGDFRSRREKAASHLETLSPAMQNAFQENLEGLAIAELVINLRRELHDPNWLSIYSNTWEKTLGAEVRIEANLNEVLKEITDYCRLKQTVLVLLLDELYSYLLVQHANNKLQHALSTLQVLGEYVTASNSLIKVVAVNHVSDAMEYIMTPSVRSALEKVMERFRPQLLQE